MTGKNSHGGGTGVAQVSLGGETGYQPFGPLEALYSEDVNAGRAKSARARSLLGDVAKKALSAIGKRAAQVGKDVWRGYPRTAYARARSPYPFGASGNAGAIDVSELTPGVYSPIPASQSWLQRITDKVGRYVYGAAVPDGEAKGIYVDETLLEDAEKFTKNFQSGLKETASRYAASFIEAATTVFHEYAHLFKGIESETSAEGYARDVLEKLADSFESVRYALDAYRGKTQLQPVTVQNWGWQR